MAMLSSHVATGRATSIAEALERLIATSGLAVRLEKTAVGACDSRVTSARALGCGRTPLRSRPCSPPARPCTAMSLTGTGACSTRTPGLPRELGRLSPACSASPLSLFLLPPGGGRLLADPEQVVPHVEGPGGEPRRAPTRPGVARSRRRAGAHRAHRATTGAAHRGRGAGPERRHRGGGADLAAGARVDGDRPQHLLRPDARDVPESVLQHALLRRNLGARLDVLHRAAPADAEEAAARRDARGEEQPYLRPHEVDTLQILRGSLTVKERVEIEQMQRQLDASITHTFFNFGDPMVGGYGPEQVALRRAASIEIAPP